MAAAPYVLRLPLRHPTLDQKSHVLVATTPSDDPSQPLNLELMATDSVKAYVMTLQHSRLSRYRDTESPLSESEWEDDLKALLLNDHPIGEVEAIARTTDDGYLFIDVRKTVSGHAQVLGSLKLRRSHTAEDSIDIFDWCEGAVRARTQLEKEVAELRRKHDDLQKLVAEEMSRFKELERGKREFESEHDSWLKDLLNEKKVKIRMQDQILATAHVDQKKLTALSASKRRTAVGSSKKGKRKAESPSEGLDIVHGDETDDDEADRMDEDLDVKLENQDEDVGMTTQDSETASEPEPEPEPEPKNAGRKGTRAPRASRASPASTTGSSRRTGKANAKSTDVMDESEDDSPPPKPLPGKKKKPEPVQGLADDESTASPSE